MPLKNLAVALLLVFPTFLSGCFYRITIQQGNVISESARSKLKIGMSKSQVIQLLGSPVLDNPFEENRWYYLYTQQKGGQNMVKQGYVLLFKGDRLEKIIQD